MKNQSTNKEQKKPKIISFMMRIKINKNQHKFKFQPSKTRRQRKFFKRKTKKQKLSLKRQQQKIKTQAANLFISKLFNAQKIRNQIINCLNDDHSSKKPLNTEPENHQFNSKKFLSFQDFSFEDLQTNIILIYNSKEDPIEPLKVRYLELNKKSYERVEEHEKLTVNECRLIQATFCVSEKLLKSLMQSSMTAYAHSYDHDPSEKKTQIIEKFDKKYYFKVYLHFRIIINIIHYQEQQSGQQKGTQKSIDQDPIVDLFPNHLKNHSFTCQELHKRYTQSLLELKCKENVSEDQLMQKNIERSIFSKIARLMFQDFKEEQFDKKALKRYFVKIQNYHRKMKRIFKNLDDIIFRSHHQKDNIKRLSTSLEPWRIFMQFFTLNSLKPDQAKIYKQQLAIKIVTEFKQLYLIETFCFTKQQQNIENKESLVNAQPDLEIYHENEESHENIPEHFDYIVEQNLAASGPQKKFLHISQNYHSDEIVEQIPVFFQSQKTYLPNNQNNQGDKSYSDQIQGIADFIFRQNLQEAKILAKFISKDENQPNKLKKQSSGIGIWTKDQHTKLLCFMILHHKQVLKNQQAQFGTFHLISKIIKTKTSEQCKRRLFQVLHYYNHRKEYIPKSSQQSFIDLIFKNEIEEHEMISGIVNLIGSISESFFLDFDESHMNVSKNCKRPINDYFKQFFKQRKFQISFYE